MTVAPSPAIPPGRPARRTRPLVVVTALGLALAACAGPSEHKPVATPAPPPPPGVPAPPQWRPGDRWVYDWITAAGAAPTTKTASVIEIKEVNTVRYYVVRV